MAASTLKHGRTGPKPGEFPLGSPQSRAAARAQLERRYAGRKTIDFIVDLGMSIEDLKIGEWIGTEDGTLSRISLIPEGMTMEEAERIVAERERTASPSKQPHGR